MFIVVYYIWSAVNLKLATAVALSDSAEVYSTLALPLYRNIKTFNFHEEIAQECKIGKYRLLFLNIR